MDNLPIVIAAGAIVGLLLWRTRQRRTPEEALQAAELARERDVQRTKAIEAADRSNTGPGGF
jgi:hypothetical protein